MAEFSFRYDCVAQRFADTLNLDCSSPSVGQLAKAVKARADAFEPHSSELRIALSSIWHRCLASPPCIRNRIKCILSLQGLVACLRVTQKRQEQVTSSLVTRFSGP